MTARKEDEDEGNPSNGPEVRPTRRSDFSRAAVVDAVAVGAAIFCRQEVNVQNSGEAKRETAHRLSLEDIVGYKFASDDNGHRARNDQSGRKCLTGQEVECDSRKVAARSWEGKATADSCQNQNICRQKREKELVKNLLM